jgi:parallel beta-helix repeat protein
MLVMKRKMFSAITLTLLLTSMITLAFNIQPVKASGTIYIRADGSVEGTDDIHRDGDVYSFTDNIYDEIRVERSNIIIDGAGYTVEGTGSGFSLSGITNVTIKNTNIKNFSYGVWLDSSSSNSISGNNITNNEYGIRLGSSSSNSISGNNITNNYDGIWLIESSNYNSISGNSIANNEYGIHPYFSSNNLIYHNNFIGNAEQVYSTGSVNVWDDDYPSGGNYWSDYNSTDFYSGLYQNETPESATYDQMEQYYDSRKAVVTITIDDYPGYEDHPIWSSSIFPMMKQKNLYFTIGMMTDAVTNAEWSYLQNNMTTNKFVEAGSHSRTHPHIPYIYYGWEINGSKQDITGNLTLPTWWTMNSSEYVYVWIRPYGSSDSSVQTWLGDSYYLCDRGTRINFDGFASWDSKNEIYPNVGVSIWITPSSSVFTLNNKFNSVYNAGGIYHFATHGEGYQPANWSQGGNADQHTDHISNKTDVWYVPFGLLYLYHFFQDRNSTLNLISISESGNGENKITQFTVNSTYHQRYGMTYPMTYRFSIPPTWTEGYVYYRYRTTDPWILMPNKTSSDFFNGIIASRFNFTSDKAYISVNFGSVSNNIYLMIRSTKISTFTFSSDGIGDTPYVIDVDNQDRYPLMHPWSSLPVHNINTGSGYATIQEAINANETLNGHTIFVEEGTYYEHVTINKSIELIGEDRSTTIIDGGSTAVVVNVTASGVTISHFTIQHGEGTWPSCGIFTYHSSNNIIDSNIVLNNTYGIYLYELCNSNIITGNNVSNNKDGIWLAISSDNIVEENNVYSNDECGVVLGLSDNNTVSYNDFSKNGIGIILTESSNNTVSDNDVYLNSGNGIQLSASDYNILIGNNAYSNNKGTGPPYSLGGGVVLGLSNNNTVDGNDVYSNGNYGIWLDQCADNWVSNNKVWDNYVGIYVTSSNNTNTVGYNDASDNYYGILLGDSGNSIVIGNHVSGNQAGICFLASSSDNTVTCNNVSNNYIGIYLQFEPCKNLIFHNNFINNTQHVGIYPSGYAYSWDDGYPSGGNYWSDYVGVDVKSGPGQDLHGSDSIGDVPYIIDADNVDHYPLMKLYGAPPPPTYTLTITTTVGGTTNPAPGTYTYTANSTVQVTAIPEANYLFDYWKFDGVNVGSANPYSVLMDKNHALKAVFSPIPPPPKPVGGYSILIQTPTTEKPLSLYLTIMAILTAAFTTVKRKTHKRRKQPHTLFSL